MRFNIRMKVGLPLTATVILLGALSYFFMQGQLDRLKDSNVQDIINGKTEEVYQSIDTASLFARDMAALFSRMPEVVSAFETAHQGNIDDERDAGTQAAREMLRRDLKPVLQGYKDVSGRKFRLHFHLSNGRSLVRLWRDRQAKRNGKWVDISDDLSSFRQTVLDVNSSGRPVQGIELGRGGFVIRGLAPVTAPSGRQLGSVEVLVDFQPILEAASRGEGRDILLYMNADRLKITTRLQDSEKFPVLADRYVLVSGSRDKSVEKLVEPEFLDGGRTRTVRREIGKTALAAFPIKDYRGQQIGVMVYAADVSHQAQIADHAVLVLGGLLLAILLMPGIIGNLVVGRFVVRPVRKIMDKITDIAEDRADLTDRLDDSQKDELGELAGRFNRLMDKLRSILDETEGYVNMLNAVPDPIFAVDRDWNVMAANSATQKLLGKDMAQLKGRRCMDLFSTEACGTENCPVKMAQKAQGFAQSEILDLSAGGKSYFIQPIGNLVRDKQGNTRGYVEIARNVTDLVLKEREIAANMERLDKINAQAAEAAAQIARTSTDLSGQFGEISHGASNQRDRAAETATAMEQMNATVLEVARNASRAADEAGTAKDKAVEGADIVSQAVYSINEVHQRALGMKENMGRLGKQADGIGQIMNVITDIADQTNLLALNAAIEAARAGDAGRGFAVVADEVRKLAEKTMSATKEVGDAIKAIQDGAARNISEVDKTADIVAAAAELGNRSGEALQEIVSLVMQTTDQVQSIAAAAEEQSAASEQINRAVMDVNRIADETSSGISRSTTAINQLSELADRLKKLSEG